MSAENKAKKDLLYADLSGKIIGAALNVRNTLGHGHPEKTYQKALAIAFSQSGLSFIEQLYVLIVYGGKVVGKNFLDFLVDNKVVVEIKKGDYFVKSHIDQVYQYLVSKKLQLGLLMYFAPKTVHIKRIVNLDTPYIRN